MPPPQDINKYSLYSYCRLPVPQQNLGTIFLKVSQEVRHLMYLSLSLSFTFCICVCVICLDGDSVQYLLLQPSQGSGSAHGKFVRASYKLILKKKMLRLLFAPRDKLSAFMESKGAASPGMLTLTSNLSKVRQMHRFMQTL